VLASRPVDIPDNPFSWSVSRHDTFHSCRRKYFYSYYAAREDPEVHRLKKLSALPLWAGSVVHETIEEILKTRDALPSDVEQEAIVHAAVHARMLGEWRASEAGVEPGRFRLFEHEYETPVEQEDKKLLVTIVMRSLRNFFRSEVLQEAFAVGRANWLTVEDLATFTVGDVEVRLRMDLAFRDREGRVVIVDWKTGRNEGHFSEVQLAGYALYAAEQGWVQAAEELRTELAYLVIPRFVRRTVDARTLDNARAFIQKSAGSMRELLVDPGQNAARLEDFAMVDRPQRCRRCNFRRLCFPREAEAAAVETAVLAS
jgi:CRISPR/Cas system-associated exonuclease Cas4 (RecB family)